MPKIGMSLFAGVVMLSAIACDDGVADKTENRAKCRQICSQVNECDDSVDTGECTDECADRATNDEQEALIEDCSECLEIANSCSENVQQCATTCIGVVELATP